jgi:hypothetical protein
MEADDSSLTFPVDKTQVLLETKGLRALLATSFEDRASHGV